MIVLPNISIVPSGEMMPDDPRSIDTFAQNISSCRGVLALARGMERDENAVETGAVSCKVEKK